MSSRPISRSKNALTWLRSAVAAPAANLLKDWRGKRAPTIDLERLEPRQMLDGVGLLGTYYDNADFTSAQLTRLDTQVDFDWAQGSPDAAVSNDTFSVRWTGRVEAQYSETYTFYVNSDDGAKLWVNGQLVVDNWSQSGSGEASGTIALTAGQKYDIQLDYKEETNNANVSLAWSSASQTKQVIPYTKLYAPVLFSDDFNRSDSTNIGSSWTEQVGDVQISSNKVTTGTSSGATLLANGVSEGDVAVSADYDFTSTSQTFSKIGVLARATSNASDYYSARIYRYQSNYLYYAQLYRRTGNGTPTLLAEKMLGNGAGGADATWAQGNIRLEVVGTSLAMFLNDEMVVSYEDTSASKITSAGTVGGIFEGANVKFDNLTVEKRTSGTANATLPVADAFDRGNTPKLGDIWSEQSGDFVLNNGAARAITTDSASNGGVRLATINGISSADVSVSAYVDLSAVTPVSANAGVVARVNGTTYYGARLNKNGPYTLQIGKVVSGTWTTLGSAGTSLDKGALRLEVIGNSLALYFNEVQKVSIQDSTITPAGTVGIYASTENAAIDTFAASVRSNTPQNATLPYSDDFNRTDSPILGSYWTEQQGDLSVVSNKASSSAPSGSDNSSSATLNGVWTTDVSQTVNVTLANSGLWATAGLSARANGTDMYVGRIQRYSGVYYAEIRHKLGSTWTTLDSRLVSGVGTLQFDVVGTNLTLYLNGELVARASDSSITGAGGIGLYANDSNVTFDNYSAQTITSPSSQNASLPHADDFNRSSSTFLGGKYTEQEGDFSVSANGVKTLVDGDSSVMLNGVSAADVNVSVDYNLSKGSDQDGVVGLDARVGGGNGYRGQIHRYIGGYHAEILNNVSGTWTTLASSTVTSSSGELRFEVHGTTLTLYVNGRPTAAATDGAISAAGLVGVFAAKASAVWDNLAVSVMAGAPTAENAALSFTDNFDRADSAYPGAVWSEVEGDFAVGSNQLLNRVGGDSTARLNGISAADVSVSALVDLNDAYINSQIGLDVRVNGTTFYRGQLRRYGDTSFAEIIRSVSGSTVTLISKEWGGHSGTLRFDVVGNALGVYLNDKLIASFKDTSGSAISAAGTIGLYSSATGTVDDFSAAVLVPPTTQNGSLTFSDSFDRADDTISVGAMWTEEQGDIAICDNKLVGMASGASIVTVNGISVSDVVLSANVSVPASQKVGLVARYTGSIASPTYYLGLLNANGTGEIWKCVDGTSTPLGAMAAVSTSGNLRFELNGTLLQLFLNDELVVAVNNAAITAAGAIGAYADQNPVTGYKDGTIDGFTARAPLSIGNVWLALPANSPAKVNYWDAGASLVDVLVGDFNGDRRKDMIGRNPSTGAWIAGISDGATGGFTTSEWGTWSTSETWVDVRVGDFNGDGIDDIAGRAQSTGAWHIARSSGSAFVTATWGTWSGSGWSDVSVGDFNGDRRDDLIARNSAGVWWTALSTGLSFTSQSWGTWANASDYTDVRVGDFDGDGRDDIVARRETTGAWRVGISSGNSFASRDWATWNPSTTWVDIHVGDFDGDGRDDIIGRASGNSMWQVSLSQGSEFDTQGWGGATTVLVDVTVGDLDGDGRDDLIGRVGGTREWRAALSTGSNFSEQYWMTFSSALDSQDALIGDFFDLRRAAADAFSFVYNNIEFQPYPGQMKGPEATRDTRAGNDWDQNALLISLLEPLGIKTRYQFGRIEVSAADVLQWVGARDAASAERILDAAQLNADRINPGSSSETIELDHLWVEAFLPGSGGLSWRPLDASFKFKAYQPGTPDGVSLVPFDRTTYLSGAQPVLPFEYYEDQISSYFQDNQQLKSVADVPYDGPIIQKRFESVPSALPYLIIGVPAQSLGVPANMTHRARIRLQDVFTFGGAVLSTPIDYTVSLPELGPRALTIAYATSPDGRFIPELRLDDAIVETTNERFVIHDDMRLVIDHLDPGDATVDRITSFNRKAGEHLAIGLNASQFSEKSLAQLHARANEAALEVYEDLNADPLPAFNDGLALTVGRYIKDLNDQTAIIGGLHQMVPIRSSVSASVVTGLPEISYNWSAELPVGSMRIGIDYRGGGGSSFVAIDNASNTHSRHVDAFRLVADNSSALEAWTIESLWNARAVSAVTGIQWAHDHDIAVFEIDSTNKSTLFSQLVLAPQTESTISDYIDDGWTVIVPQFTLNYPLWRGDVYISVKETSTSIAVNDAISGTYVTNGSDIADFALDVASKFLDLLQDLVSDPVNVANGAVYHDELDVKIPSPGVALSFARHYKSSETSDVGLGVGWTHTYSERLSTAQNGHLTWYTSEGISYDFAPNGTGGYTTPPGLYGALTAQSGGYQFREKGGLTKSFDSTGRLVEVADANGNGFSITYTTSGELEAVTDLHDSSRWLHFSNTDGHMTSMADFTGRTWTYSYQEATEPGTLFERTYLATSRLPSDASTPQDGLDYLYHEGGVLHGLLRNIEQPATGGRIEFDYYPNRKAFRVTDMLGNEEILGYDHFHGATRYVNARGNSTFYRLDESGLSTKVTNPDRSRVTTVWSNRLIQSRTDELGRTELYDYDSLGNVTEHVGADGVVTTYTYEPVFSQLTSISQVGDRTEAFTYDTNGNLLEAEDALGNLTTWTYDSRGRVETITTPRGNAVSPVDQEFATTLTHNAAGQPLTIATGSLPVVTRTYDNRGNLLTEQTGSGPVRSMQYNLHNRNTQVALPDPDGTGPLGAIVEGIAHPSLTRHVKTSPSGLVSETRYDLLGRLTRSVNADGTSTEIAYDAVGNRVSEVDAVGRGTHYIWDDRERLVQVLHADGSGERYSYDGGGRQVAMADARGNVTSYTYDRGDRILSITDAIGQVTTLEYNVVGELISEAFKGPADITAYRTTTYTRDLLGRITQTRGAAGYVTTTDYDADGSISKQTQYDVTALGSIPSDPRTLSSSLKRNYEKHFDAWGREIEQIDPASHSSYTGYDAAGRVHTTTDENGNTTTFDYDNAGRLVRITQPDPDGTGPLTSPVSEYEIDVDGNVMAVIDPNEHTTSYVYDALGRQISRTNANNNTATYTFDPAGQLVLEVDELGYATYYVYDDHGQIVRTVLPDPDGDDALLSPVLKHGFDANGNRIISTDALGNTTSYEYDALNRVSKVTQPDPDGIGGLPAPSITYTYEHGDMISETDHLSRVTSYTYDKAGRLLSKTLPDPDGGGSQPAPKTTYVYDALGNLTSMTDPLGNAPGATASDHTTVYTYDVLSRKLTEKLPDPDGPFLDESDPENPVLVYEHPTTTWTYDNVGNMLTLKDAANNTTTWTYDNLDRVVTEKNQLNQTRTFRYDPVGNKVSVTDRNGRTREFVYDNVNNVLQEKWLAGEPGSTVERTITYTYDANGHLLSATDPDSTYAMTYDGLGRVLTIDNDGTSNHPRVILTQAYDANGRRTSLAATSNGTADFSNTYSYDSLDRMVQVLQAGVTGGASVANKRVDFSYNAAGFHNQITRYSDLSGTNLVATSTYGYDSTGRLTSLTHARGSTTIASYGWTFDPASRITQFSLGGSNGTVTYTYDANGQVVTADRLGRGGEFGPEEQYGFDLNGSRNWGSFPIWDNYDPYVRSYGVGADNRALDNGNGGDFEHDGEGNLISNSRGAGDFNWSYTYDHRNQLVEAIATSQEWDDQLQEYVTVTQRIVRFTYDVFGRRIEKEVSILGGIGEEGPWYNTTVERYAYDGENMVLVFNSNGTIKARYLQGPGIDQVIAEESSGSVKWMLPDHQSSIRHVINSSGTVLNHIIYDAFGNVDAQTNAAYFPRFNYTGREFDVETGLHYYRARYYDAWVGRFISQDPTGFRSGDHNLYRYVFNSAPNMTDPSGSTAVPTGLEWMVPAGAAHELAGWRALLSARFARRAAAGALLGFALGAIWVIFGQSMQVIGSLQLKQTGQPQGGNEQGGNQRGGGNRRNRGSGRGGNGKGGTGEKKVRRGTNENPVRTSNPKHHPNSKSPEPKNVDDLWNRAIRDKDGVGWSKDADGTIHRFSEPNNGASHWNGSTGGREPIRMDDIPIEIRRALG